MKKNLFCYVEENDIKEELKASENNENCIGCVYLEICKDDLKDKVSNKDNVIKETVDEVEKTEKDSTSKTIETKPKESKPKEEKPKVPKAPKKPKKPKKPTLEDLAEEDIF